MKHKILLIDDDKTMITLLCKVLQFDGFDVISFDGYITTDTIKKIKKLLFNPDEISQMVEKNYMLGWRYLSYEMLEERLEQLLIDIYGS
ncbi:MAG: hypothetical protein JRF72_17185 [Deltaproteobacteria bacterium]|jgi:CheY-like chemotaxis protein|nr:hypothetical protein [Deltaproteobacteria bacterium]